MRCLLLWCGFFGVFVALFCFGLLFLCFMCVVGRQKIKINVLVSYKKPVFLDMAKTDSLYSLKS